MVGEQRVGTYHGESISLSSFNSLSLSSFIGSMGDLAVEYGVEG